MDERSGLCQGCARTLDEIARWASMSDAERDRIFLVLEERKKNGGSDIAKIPVPPLA
jgi:predicted Fe-S protein YdhL (DUF1289 family)